MPIQNGGALAGLRVIDLTQMLAGPYCTMLLADQGADVVKIEPVDGDPTRHFGPFRADDAEHHFGGYFQSTNRNKKSIAPRPQVGRRQGPVAPAGQGRRHRGGELPRRRDGPAGPRLRERWRRRTPASSTRRSAASAIRARAPAPMSTAPPSTSSRRPWAARWASPAPTPNDPDEDRSRHRRHLPGGALRLRHHGRRCITRSAPARASSSTWRCMTASSRCASGSSTSIPTPASRRSPRATSIRSSAPSASSRRRTAGHDRLPARQFLARAGRCDGPPGACQ